VQIENGSPFPKRGGGKIQQKDILISNTNIMRKEKSPDVLLWIMQIVLDSTKLNESMIDKTVFDTLSFCCSFHIKCP
jgi:hypothetical protein